MPLCPEAHNLAYTIAFDPPGSPGHRMMAKMLASSLLRTYFGGDILIFRNSPDPLFRVERKWLEEIYQRCPRFEKVQGAPRDQVTPPVTPLSLLFLHHR